MAFTALLVGTFLALLGLGLIPALLKRERLLRRHLANLEVDYDEFRRWAGPAYLLEPTRDKVWPFLLGHIKQREDDVLRILGSDLELNGLFNWGFTPLSCRVDKFMIQKIREGGNWTLTAVPDGVSQHIAVRIRGSIEGGRRMDPIDLEFVGMPQREPFGLAREIYLSHLWLARAYAPAGYIKEVDV